MGGDTENICSLMCRTKDKNKIKTYEQKATSPFIDKAYNYHPGMIQHSWGLKNGKSRFTGWGKLMTKFIFYNQLDPGTKDKKKPRYESRKMVLKLELGSRLTEKQKYFEVATIN